MDLRDALINIPSGVEKEMYVKAVLDEPGHVKELLQYTLYEKDPLAWRSAWVLDCSDEVEEGLASEHLSEIIQRLPMLDSKGSLRCLLRMLSRYDIAEEDQGLLLDQCFSYLVSALYPVAVKVHAMTIIYQHVLIYPELKEELSTMLKDQMDNNSVGFASRARRLIKAMEKM